MRFGHPATTPCPPSRDDLIVGPGGLRTDGDGAVWCCHSSRHLTLRDVARQRRETVAVERGIAPRPKEQRPSRFPDGADLPDLDSLTPTTDDDGRLPPLPDIVWGVHTLTPAGDET